jgi:hypothetical protein
MKRHRVGEVGVEQDDVVLVLGPRQEQPAVLSVQLKIFVFGQVEVIFGDRITSGRVMASMTRWCSLLSF